MIDDFSRKANQYLAEDILVGQGNTDSDWHDVELGDEAILPLPSNISADQCRDHGVGYLVDDELKLRQGQANDALHNIRINLGHRSFLYRTAVRQVKHSQHKKLRAWDAVHQVNTALNVHTAIYRRCCKAMIALGASSVLLQRYQELKEEHLQSKTIEIDPSVTGMRGENLPWFWTMNADLQAGNWMSEFFRVKFHRAKANIDRCTEEVALLKMEMRWTANFFQHHSDKWRRFAAEAEAKWDVGRVCFTKKQTKTWGILHEQVVTLIHRFRLA
ncbi:hypothetical protein PAXINDRAFT_88630 [Paxillus involutus ATCC 200175]|uniref:Uncharacterized protein n=1 Tax=Paxillus involutus ATCC 200175 TaxID=664439 RepID=A0A0C9TC46_PAXIN|nr:hypothetical protein PAXINDRAFT_88630 [Paxillus involutus ATCC 200175]